jgi:hypothetical protein
MTSINLPSATITFDLPNRQLELDVIDAIMGLESATAGIPQSDSIAIIRAVHDWFWVAHQVELTSSQILAASTAIRAAYSALKKKLDSELKSTFGMGLPPASAIATSSSSPARSPTSEQLSNVIDELQQLNNLASQLSESSSPLPKT